MSRFSDPAVGVILAVGAYLIWGSFPLFIDAASFASPFEVVVWRVVFGFVLAALIVTITRSWTPIIALVKKPKSLIWVFLAAVFIYANWQTYVFGVATGNVLETSLGYFINPLFTVLLGVLVLREKLRPLQWVALGIGFVAVIVVTFDFGRLPWIAFVLAGSFGMYSLAKNKMGSKVRAIHSFTIESGFLLPFAIIQLFIVGSFVQIQFGVVGVMGTSALIAFGFMTAVPLILFGAAASKIRLSSIGFIQYLTPVIQFLLGLFYFGEQMGPVRWAGFILVWIGLVVLTFDAYRDNRMRVSITT
ncbi:MAG: EamA family transporter RarD [Microbacteriaceae bacterium]|nr:EamA family transporter RarD [Microbacteriaceae bacterium]MDR9444096.1 EamA family transporter RarD [Microbacteriaceae bacterium]